MNTFNGIKDMLDGGGPGQSGAQFQGGGLLSRIGNDLRSEADFQTQLTERHWQEQRRRRMAMMRLFGLGVSNPANRFADPTQGTVFGYPGNFAGPGMRQFDGITDMLDGGGPGQSGGPFRGGGLLSTLANVGAGKV